MKSRLLLQVLLRPRSLRVMRSSATALPHPVKEANSSYADSSRAVSLVGVMSHEGVSIPCDRIGAFVGVVMVFNCESVKI